MDSYCFRILPKFDTRRKEKLPISIVLLLLRFSRSQRFFQMLHAVRGFLPPKPALAVPGPGIEPVQGPLFLLGQPGEVVDLPLRLHDDKLVIAVVL